MSGADTLPLRGIRVLEIGGGAAGAYCGRLLVDAGASVDAAATDEAARLRGIVREDSAAERAFGAWLAAGKRPLPAFDAGALCAASAAYDLVVVGEAAGVDPAPMRPARAVVALDWFTRTGPRAGWRATDLIVEALTGLPQMAGPVAGPPLHAGDRHASIVGGVTAYIAAVSALVAPAGAQPRRFALAVHEANLVLSEMHMHFFERDGQPMRRCGINRFQPNSPVGVYPCRSGWIGITATTPDQWLSLCELLGMTRERHDAQLATRELRFARLDEVEGAMIRALSAKDAPEWAALGRRHKVPMVVVPDAEGILSHPIFRERGALTTLEDAGRTLQVPRTPFSLTGTPVRATLTAAASMAGATAEPGTSPRAGAVGGSPAGEAHAPPLAGVTVVDFAMGWAGPLASRLMADLGADVIKIEAGRYPDWWRGVNWTADYIAAKGYEKATGFCALNRGKRGVSLDLTVDEGRELALELVRGADVVVENQAAGVMAKLGLGHLRLLEANPGLVMLSMSAFGTGNAWSDTRAYGSTLEQGAGLPSFMGLPGTAPTMVQLAYGDPVGGLFGCAAALTALVHRRRGGSGQYVNLGMVEAMLQFATPPLLRHQVESGAPSRLGNRHPVHVPHGLFAVRGEDEWIAIAVEDDAAFARFATVVGHPEWADDPALAAAGGRRAREADLEAAIARWAAGQDRDDAVARLQAAGVAAAPLAHAERLFDDPQLAGAGFFLDLVRAESGPQRQAGVAIVQDGVRLGARRPAPLMGEHSGEVLAARAGVDALRFETLVARDVVCFEPKALRATILPSGAAGGA